MWLRTDYRPPRVHHVFCVLSEQVSVALEDVAHELADEPPKNPELGERVALLRQIIATLDPLNRALLLLYLDDCSYREIAAVLGLTETNVATKLSRLKEHLRQKLINKP